MTDRGDIYCEEAYAQGKMLDHSKWTLPRNITPSDIDMVFDDGRHNRIVLVELTSQFTGWEQLPQGQISLYSRIVTKGDGKVFAVLARHNTPWNRKIDTRNDIEHFQVLYLAKEMELKTSQVYDGDKWPLFIEHFYDGRTFSFRQQ